MKVAQTRLQRAQQQFKKRIEQDHADWQSKIKSQPDHITAQARFGKANNPVATKPVSEPTPPVLKTSFVSNVFVGSVVVAAIVAVAYKYARF